MKVIPFVLGAFLCLSACSRTRDLQIYDNRIEQLKDLKPNIGNMIVLAGKYHNPGKGDRVLRCGFTTFRIADYSLYLQKPTGELIPQVAEGEDILVRARLRYFAGSRVPIEEEKFRQTTTDRIETIDGQTYSVHTPHYYIEEVSLIQRTKEK